MRLYLQNTNSADRRHIKQALSLKSKRDAVKKGWKQLGLGYHKIAFKKGKIVVKFPRRMRDSFHLVGETEKYFSIPKYYRRYLARIFGGDEEKIIQRYVPINDDYDFSAKEHIRCNDLVDLLDIDDADLGHNATIVKGRPIIYDFGY